MLQHRFPALVASLFAFVVASCSSGPESPGTIQTESVALDIDVSAPAFVPTLDGPLRLLSATPAGAMPALPPGQTVAVTFSRPMVPLGEAPPVPPGTLTFSPPIEGSFRWEGSQTLVFTPLAPLPPATAYEARLGNTLTALDGEALPEPYTWTFETPRPAVEGSQPANGESYADPAQALTLRFNLPVDAAAVTPYLSLSERRDDTAVPVGFTVRVENDRTVLLRPAEPLTPGTSYQLVARAGLPTPGGPLGMERSHTVTFSTYGPLALDAVEQPRNWWEEETEGFDPERGLTIRFNNPVRFGDLRQALTFTPPVTFPPGIEARDDASSTRHTVSLPLQPETDYRVVIRGLTDQFGQVLDSAAAAFHTGAYTPALRMPEGVMVVEAAQQAVVPVHVTNVEAAMLGVERLAADAVVPALRAYDTGHYYGDRPEGAPRDRVVPATRTLSLGVPRNAPGTYRLRLDSLLGAGTGVVGLHLRVPQQPGWTGERAYRGIAQVTRLGLSAKFSPHQNLIFVTHLETAAPVAGARVTIRDDRNAVRWTGETDAQGRALSPGWAGLGIEPQNPWSRPLQYVLVEKDGDLAFTASNYEDGIEPYRFGLDYAWRPEAQTYGGSVFTDRGLYRAGDAVYLKGLVRRRTDGDWKVLGDAVRIFIDSPRAERVLERVVTPGPMGSFDLEWTAPPDADLGAYTVRVALAADTLAADRSEWEEGDVTRGGFRVDAFRTATFNVAARTSAPSYVAGDFFEGTISGRYLFGAAMGGQPVRYRLTRSADWYTPPGFDAYRFGSYGYAGGLYLELAREEGELDADGLARLRVPLPGNEHGRTTRLTFEATVTDPARQELSGRAEVMLHPARYYIGLKPRTTFLDLGADPVLVVDVVTVSPDGKAVDAQEVAVEVIRRQWNSIREVGVDGRLNWRSEMTEERVAVDTVRTEPGRAQRLRTRIAQGGSYVVRATGYDLRGNVTRSEAYFYATGGGYVAWERRDDDRIDLVADRTSYRPGETARIMVQSPYESATALITVEREGILSSRVETLVGSAPQVEIPLTEAHLPNAFVSVILLQGRTARPGTTDDAGAPGFKVGYVNLPVDPGVRHLAVEVTPDRTEYRPGDEVTVNFRLRDAGGRGVPGEVAFSAADAGVLNLIGYALPDPFDAFYGPRRLHVSSTETRANLVKQRSFGQKEEDEGGGGGDATEMLRTDFRPLAHWEPSLQTDAGGRASVTFRLPESLTTFRLMATAHTADSRFGASHTDVVVTKPLVLQPALPRFARLGDRFEAGVLVTNTTGATGEAVVTARATGLTLASDGTQRVPLADGETKEVRFRWQVDEAADAELTFSATLEDEQDGLVTTLPVTLPTTKHTAATFASTDGTATEALQVPEDRIPGLGRFEAKLASTVLVGLDEAARYLFEYPYGCLEQRTSGVRPLLLADEILDAFDLDVLDGNRRREIDEWLGLLERYWTGNGFSLWPGGRYRSPYVSAYVVAAMAEAEAAGFDVPDAFADEAVEALAQHVRSRSERPSYYSPAVWEDTRAFMLYALARNGRVLDDEVATLADALLAEPRAGIEGIAHLLRLVTLVNRPTLNRYQAPLLERLRASIRIEATTAYLSAPESYDYWWIFSSGTRATAYGLTALIEAAPNDDTRQVAQRMVRYLMNMRQGGHWASTQENAAVVDAFRAFFEAYETDVPDFAAEVRLAGQTVLRQSFQGRSTAVASADLTLDALPPDGPVAVEVDKTGAGQLYYALLLQTYSNAPQRALDQGLRVERRLQRLDDAGRPTGEDMTSGGGTLRLQAGELVRVTLHLTSPADRNYVVVDDALPAGLEALNTAFETTSLEDTRGAGGDRWWGSFNHTEIHDDRVLLFADYLMRGDHTYTYVARATTPGTFVHPPVQGELMYQPETNGRNATGTLVVELPAGEVAAQ